MLKSVVLIILFFYSVLLFSQSGYYKTRADLKKNNFVEAKIVSVGRTMGGDFVNFKKDGEKIGFKSKELYALRDGDGVLFRVNSWGGFVKLYVGGKKCLWIYKSSSTKYFYSIGYDGAIQKLDKKNVGYITQVDYKMVNKKVKVNKGVKIPGSKYEFKFSTSNIDYSTVYTFSFIDCFIKYNLKQSSPIVVTYYLKDEDRSIIINVDPTKD